MMKNKKKPWKRMQREKNSVEDLNELSIVGDNDGNPEPRCSISNIIITTISVSLVSISYFTTSPEAVPSLTGRIPPQFIPESADSSSA